jgi:rRNA maturation RNase YbeY
VISFHAEEVEQPPINSKICKQWIKNVITGYGYKVGSISIIFCSDGFLLEYNRKYLQHDYLTDIITFNYNTNTTLSGDLFISVDTVKCNADTYNVDELVEFRRVIIHGILHLLNFNDHSEEEITEMRRQESNALEVYDSLAGANI